MKCFEPHHNYAVLFVCSFQPCQKEAVHPNILLYFIKEKVHAFVEKV
jgi:hypothetical protein